MQNLKYADLTKTQKRLVKKAYDALKYAYNPYGKFYVAAAILTTKDIIITGSNIANASWPDSICAERAAIARANALGYRKFKAIAIIAKANKSDTREVTAPCGSCRQVLSEFMEIGKKDIEIILCTTGMEKIVLTSLKELLPLSFGPVSLGIKP